MKKILFAAAFLATFSAQAAPLPGNGLICRSSKAEMNLMNLSDGRIEVEVIGKRTNSIVDDNTYGPLKSEITNMVWGDDKIGVSIYVFAQPDGTYTVAYSNDLIKTGLFFGDCSVQ
jgi:hypothetical protein